MLPAAADTSAGNKWIWQGGENLGMGEQREEIFVHPQPLWEQRELIRSIDLEGWGSWQSHVKICFHLPSSAAVWVIKLACTTSTQNTFLLPWPLDSWNKNCFQKFNTYPLKRWISILSEQYSASLKIRTTRSFFLLCNGFIVHIFMLLFWGRFKKQYFIQNGGDHC